MPTTPAPRTIQGSAPAHERPDFRAPEYVDGEGARTLSRAMMQGTRGVRALGHAGLPKWPDEEPAFYKLRARIAQVTRYYARTVEAAVSMVTASPPTLAEDAHATLRADWEDIDRRGTHGDVFVQQLTEEALIGGFAAILVDAPPRPVGVSLTLQDEQRMQLRPYWVLLRAEQILSWETESPDWSRIMTDWQRGVLRADDVARLGGQFVLRQVVIHEPGRVRHGEFGVRVQHRYRVLRLTDTGVTFAVWEHVEAEGATGEHFRLLTEGPMQGAQGRALPAIPLAVAYSKRTTTPFVCEPALMSVCEANLDHYQLTADRRYLIKHTHSPTLYLLGFQEERDANGVAKKTRIGPNAVIRSNTPEAKVGYAVAPADALTSSKEERDEVVREIAALGLSFLAKDRQRGVETATGRTLDLAAENATHATTARGVQDALEQALLFHAAYRDVPAPSIEMHPVYLAPDVDPQLAGLVWQAVLKGRLDIDTWLAFMRTGRMPENLNAADLVARLVAEMEADQEIADERARLTTDPDANPDDPTSRDRAA